MKIREKHAIIDRIKVIVILLFILGVLGNLAQYMDIKNNPQKISTIRNFLQTALKPIGSTMYIWGGGWNEEDCAAGGTATHIGVCGQWKEFANGQDENYDYTKYRFERENGLDCSGYVGWVIYNTFEKESGKEGYVTISTDMAENYAAKGWGTYIKSPTDFLPGDVVSMDGHVWICLGTCGDGSVLLVHSSPPGVSVCGTEFEEGKGSMAVELATQYMSKYHPEWQKKYPNRAVSSAYLKEVSIMRWNADTMSDVKEIHNMSGEKIIDLISPEM